MRITSRRKAIFFFLTLGILLAAVAVAVGSGWIILHWRADLKVFLGFIFFAAITAGIILNTSFLIREIRRNEQHDSFINAVTHELKTPITSIRLYLQTLQRREVDEAQRAEFYRLMIDDTDRLLGTVEQVLKAGQAGLRKSRRRTQLNLAELVGDCVELARTSHHLPPGALQYQIAVNGSGARIMGDAEDLRTAISNLLDNAVKYSGEHVDVAVRLAAPDEGHLQLSVSDHGVGIPSGELKRIFRRFYRVPNRSLGMVQGTGLGLFIVRSIAKKHGGRVYAESQGEGQGTTICMELPRSST
ncbi:MAG: two-component sensor histidine kinase [Acidobacteria bacterium]|jgi:two-component system, OmpR family, sensor histidine kinase SenX3|nr:MAG: two-component sensor histidine kinase [Acidobacteriota bacterium]